jgi:hypothetical protein
MRRKIKRKLVYPLNPPFLDKLGMGDLKKDLPPILGEWGIKLADAAVY